MRKDGPNSIGSDSIPSYRPPQAHINAHKELLKNQQNNKPLFDFNNQDPVEATPTKQGGGIDWEKAEKLEKQYKEWQEQYGDSVPERGNHVPPYLQMQREIEFEKKIPPTYGLG